MFVYLCHKLLFCFRKEYTVDKNMTWMNLNSCMWTKGHSSLYEIFRYVKVINVRHKNSCCLFALGRAGWLTMTEKEHTWVLCIDIFYILIRECLQGCSGSGGKESTCNVGDLGSIPGKIPWRRACQLTPVYLPGESHGQWSLASYGVVHGVAKS